MEKIFEEWCEYARKKELKERDISYNIVTQERYTRAIQDSFMPYPGKREWDESMKILYFLV